MLSCIVRRYKQSLSELNVSNSIEDVCKNKFCSVSVAVVCAVRQACANVEYVPRV